MDFPLGEWTGNACEIYEIMAALGPSNPDYSPIWEKIQFDANLPGFVKLGNENKPDSSKDLIVLISFALTLSCL